MFDEHKKMDAQISSVCSAGHFHLRNIGMIRKYLTADSAECLVHAVIKSRLDHGNALLYDISACQLWRLQRLQNAAARVVSRTKKYEYITPVSKYLCWLPVESRINYKFILLTFRSLHGLAPSYLPELINPYSPDRNLRSLNRHLLIIQKNQICDWWWPVLLKSKPCLKKRFAPVNNNT